MPDAGAMTGSAATAQLTLPSFDPNFLLFHAGRVISDPTVAVTELVANCWDAGAGRVEIAWPAEIGDKVAVLDNGSGMTRAEFERRWLTLNYDRRNEQGNFVEFPSGTRDRVRHAFGRNGIGRHAMFFFASEYHVRTAKAGRQIHARVRRSSGKAPFQIDILEDRRAGGTHGTEVWAKAEKVPLNAEAIGELIGSKFVADPDFKIFVNRREVTLTDLAHIEEKSRVDVPGVGEFLVRRFDTERVGRTSKQHGVAWWVRNRIVGAPSWEGVEERILDARTGRAKRFTYVVEADALAEHVKADWTGFHAADAVNKARRSVEDFVVSDLHSLTKDLRRERKRAILEHTKGTLRELPVVSQETVATFVDELQEQCPSLSERDLANAVQVMANLEKSRSGYALLDRLARLPADDLDGLNSVLSEWSVSDAKKVLGELRYRLDVIARLERLLDKEHADELHELQPIFERGLWIFGPEFESVDFTSNRQLATVVRKFFVKGETTTPERRPDFVILPDRSIGVYSSDSFGDNHEVNGLARVVVVELKKGGSTITHVEKDQAVQYAREIRRNVSRTTHVEGYVLGTDVDPETTESREANTVITPRPYAVVLKQAHARTFHLLRKLERGREVVADPELKDVLAAPLFEAI
jgi:hypothetical protein